MSNLDPFWKEDFSILYRRDKLHEFFPGAEMNFNQKLNAISRFLIYFTFLVFIMYQSVECLFLLIFGLAFLYLMYDYRIDVNVTLKNHPTEAQAEILAPETEETPGETFINPYVAPPQSQNQPRTLLDSGKTTTVEPFSGSNQLASVNEVTNAFAPPPQTSKPDPQPNPRPYPYPQQSDPQPSTSPQQFNSSINQNQVGQGNQGGLGGGSLQESSTCLPNIPGHPVPSCEKGEATALDANANLCQMPNRDNPFMNILVTDYANNPNRLPACDPEIVKHDINNLYSQNLYRNVNDVWDKNNSQRTYHTANFTTIPNDQDAFKRWVWQIPYVCKDGDLEACQRYPELQTSRHGKIF